jgi:hypothetical protein
MNDKQQQKNPSKICFSISIFTLSEGSYRAMPSNGMTMEILYFHYSAVVTSHMWLLSTWNVTSAGEKLNFKFI